MPLLGYVCPAGGEAPGRQTPVAHCLNGCTNPCVAPPLLAAMYKSDTENYHQGDYISASMIAGEGCARQIQWERFEPFYDLPRKRYWPFRGTVIHRICEGAGDLLEQYGWLQEVRMQTSLSYDLPTPVFERRERRRAPSELAELERREYLRASFEVDQWLHGKPAATQILRESLIAHLQEPVEELEVVQHFTGDYDHNTALIIVVRGTCDGYNPFKRALADMKSMADAKAEMTITGTKGGTFSKNLDDSHVWQFNIYRWLIARTPVPDGVRARFAELGLPLLRGRTYPAPTTLWMQGIGMMDMPRSGVSYALTKRGKTTVHDIDPVPVLPLHQIEEFVRPRALFWYRHLALGLPAPVVGASKRWLCKNCAFNGEVIPGERCLPTQEDVAEVAA